MYKIEKTYDIEKLIERFNEKYAEITSQSNSNNAKLIVKPPEVQMVNKKTCTKNFKAICASIKREPMEVSKFISEELKVQTSITGDGQLLISGRYNKGQIQNILTKYITSFIQCPLCKTLDTSLNKVDRITYILCNRCHGQTTISV